MEEKLIEFRKRKKREYLKQKTREIIGAVMEKVHWSQVPLLSDDSVNCSIDTTGVQVQSDDDISIASSNFSINSPTTSWSVLTIMTYVLYSLLWLTSYCIAIQLEFGYVYLIISALIFIYFNTRTGPKKEGEISAYSVFNPNCEAIDGTLKAEQFEREFNLIKHVTSSPNS